MENESKTKKEGAKIAYASVAVIIGLLCIAISVIVSFVRSGGWLWLAIVGGIILISALFSKGKQ